MTGRYLRIISGLTNEIVFSPTFSGSIAAAGKKPMQHGEINRPLNVKVVAASFEQRLNHLLNTPDPQHRDGLSLSSGMGIDNGEVFAMTQSRAHQRLEPSAGLEFIEPAQSPKDLLAHLLTLAHAMDNLEILVGTDAFDSEKHCSLLSATRTWVLT